MPGPSKPDDMPTRSVPSPEDGRRAGPDDPTVRDRGPGVFSGRGAGGGLSGSGSGSADGERFAPGTMLAGRYRIVSKLGAGGMGAVYRAEDLTLGQTVALKFLPPEVAGDPVRSARLRQEVRVGREVSHPAVCRVYDIGEHVTERGTETFLSMEYIDGEDLASLLRRIGALPREKALQVVRQVSAGLAAAHERGVLHRDLKPANIMLDGRGAARISDFGLAALGGRVSGSAAAAGTPLYMAPEQLRGEEATARSDIYALGLIIYELMTGGRPHEAETFEEMRLVRSNLAASTERVLEHPDLDPLIGRVVARCLDPDPMRRPASALSVAAALPGGDPLAAALAAGETPSPDMVAGAGGVGRLHPALALLMLVVSIALPIGGSMWASKFAVSTYQPLETPPVVMRHEANEVLEQLGLQREWAQTAHGYDRVPSYMRWAAENPDPARAAAATERALCDARPPYVVYWFRASPSPWSEPADAGFYRGPVSANKPPRAIDGEVYVSLDLKGHVRRLFVQPSSIDTSETRAFEGSIDEGLLIRLCGFDPAAMTAAEPRVRLSARADRKLAWTGVWPERPEIPVRVEAGITDGGISYLMSLSPWELDVTSAPDQPLPPDLRAEAMLARGKWVGRMLFASIIGLIFVGAWLCRRNIASGRADLRGAHRLALFSGGTMMVARWLVSSELSPRTRFDVLDIMAWGMLMALGTWSAYIAIEPFVRRRWPTTLIAWTRLIGGRPMDPLVGRSVLLGVSLGVIAWAGYGTASMLALGESPADRAHFQLGSEPPWVYVGTAAVSASVQTMTGLLFVLVLVGIRRVVRHDMGAMVLMAAVFFAFDESREAGNAISTAWSAVVCAALACLYVRAGLLTAVAFMVCTSIVRQTYAVADWTAWYAWPSIVPTVVIGAAATWGAWASAFGRSAPDPDPFASGSRAGARAV